MKRWPSLNPRLFASVEAVTVGPAAIGVWASALTWSAAYTSDLTIPDYVLVSIMRPTISKGALRKIVDALLGVGMFSVASSTPPHTVYRIVPIPMGADPAFRLVSDREVSESWSTAAYALVYARDGKRCRYCGDANGPHSVDHVTPRVQGGDDSADNLVVACVRCNSRKGGRTPTEACMVLLPVPAVEDA